MTYRSSAVRFYVTTISKAVCGLIACAVVLACATAHADQPNILVVFTDDMGWGDLGVFYQNESKHDKRHRTPHLDRLAAGGLQMRAHYCPAPVCAPSRSSLLTGVHQGNAVVRNNQFDKELEDNHTLGSVLREAGYRTCMIGKYGLQGGPQEKQQTGTPSDWPSYPTKRGFDEFFGYVSHYAGHLHYPNDPWKLANEGHRGVPNLWLSTGSKDYEISESLSKCYTTDLFTAAAKHFLKLHVDRRANQPFFLMLNYDTPHAALQIPTGPYPSGGGIDGGVQWTGGNEPDSIAQPAINTGIGEVDSFIHPDYVDQPWSNVEKRFATMVRRIDSAVGDLNETLDELGWPRTRSSSSPTTMDRITKHTLPVSCGVRPVTRRKLFSPTALSTARNETVGKVVFGCQRSHGGKVPLTRTELMTRRLSSKTGWPHSVMSQESQPQLDATAFRCCRH